MTKRATTLKQETIRYSQCRPEHGFEGESDDCVVRAMSIALNLPYRVVHPVVERHGRPKGEGASRKTVMKTAEEFYMEEITFSELCDIHGAGRLPTVTQFIKTHPTGTFYVHQRGHAFAIIDGVVHDWGTTTGAKTRIRLAMKVGKDAAEMAKLAYDDFLERMKISSENDQKSLDF